jgi:hypothetical protein
MSSLDLTSRTAWRRGGREAVAGGSDCMYGVSGPGSTQQLTSKQQRTLRAPRNSSKQPTMIKVRRS